FYHPFHEVFKDFFLHLMPVEAVGILINVGLQVEYRMVDAPQPGFEQHNRPMELGEVLPLLFRFLPDQLWEFAFQAFIAAPPVCPHSCTGSYMVRYEPLQVLPGSSLHYTPIDAGDFLSAPLSPL